jgi:SAM-dependent methyltransferase
MAFMPRERDFLADFEMLAKRFPREVARAALTIAILRGEAKNKFPQAEKMYFTREALEQATPYPVARHRARRYRGFTRIFDLACSIGGDTVVLAGAAPVVGVDRDPLRLAMAYQNAKALRVPAEFTQADLANLPFAVSQFDDNTAMFFDPSRRMDHKRAFSVENYYPPLSIIIGWLESVSALGAKVSPGVILEELSSYDCEVEFISLNGDLKEAMLWFGPLKTVPIRATLLPGGHTLTMETQPVLPLSKPRGYLYEPDAAVLRAGLVQAVGGMLDAAMLDPEIAYLTADEFIPTPFARAWPVLDWMPFHLKKLRAYLRDSNVGAVTIKKRGSPLVIEELANQLRLKGDDGRTLFLTHMQGQHIVVVAGEEIKRMQGR